MKPRKPIGNLTLIGLLAVIVVIDIRTATLLPALHGAKVGTIEGDWN
jgi:hypothetical protein